RGHVTITSAITPVTGFAVNYRSVVSRRTLVVGPASLHARSHTRATSVYAASTSTGSRAVASGAGVFRSRSTRAETTRAAAVKPAEVRNAACSPGTNCPGTAPAAYTDTMTAI